MTTSTPIPLTRIRLSRRIAALLIALPLALAGCASPGAESPQSGSSSESASATKQDDSFNRTFTHKTAQVDDVEMHYVTGGTGEPLVLLHGWPQSWYAWHTIMPALAEHYTVYAVDLPGLGDSEGSPPSYDKATLAQYVHGLVADELDLEKVNLAGHDLGAGVGFQYAAQFPDEVIRYAHLDYPLPGPALKTEDFRTKSWHLSFHNQEKFPEAVVGNDVRDYIELFTGYVAHGGESFGGQGATTPFSAAQLDEFARTYSDPEVLTGGFELYRTLEQDEQDNIAATPIAMPTLLLTAEGMLPFTRSTVEPLMTQIVRAVEVPEAGHWLPDENPEFVIEEFLAFFGGTR